MNVDCPGIPYAGIGLGVAQRAFKKCTKKTDLSCVGG